MTKSAVSTTPGTLGHTDEPPAVRLSRVSRVDRSLVAGLVLVALFILPTIHDGFRADDTWSAETHGMIELSHQSLPGYLGSISHTFWQSGRPNPLGPILGSTLAWAIGNHPMLTHGVLNLLLVLAAWALYALVRELGLSRAAALLILAVVAGGIQLRSYHDPVIGYWGTTQLLLALLLISLLLFARGLRTGSRRLLVWSFVAFLPCPLIYEIAYPLVALHLAIALFYRRGWAALRVAAPFLAVGALFVLLSLYLRTVGTSVVPGYEVGGGPWATLRTFLIQLFAPIPGSTLMFRAEYANFIPLGGSPTKAEALAGAWRGLAVAGIVAVVGASMFRRGGARLPSSGVLWRLAVIGVLLVTTPVLVVSASPKYQNELVVGKGHLSTILQTFGFALIVVAALCVLIRAALQRSTVAAGLVVAGAASLIGFGAGVDGYNNIRVIALEVPITQSRNLLESGARDGAFASVPAGGSIVFSPQDLNWATGNFAQNPDPLRAMLLDRTGRDYDSRPASPATRYDCLTPTEAPECLQPLGANAAWARVRIHRGGGSVIVSRIAGGARDVNQEATHDIRVYVRADGVHVPAAPLLTATGAGGRPWRSDRLAWQRVDQGDGWAIYHARIDRGTPPIASTLDDIASRFDFTNPGTPAQIVRVFGTKSLLP